MTKMVAVVAAEEGAHFFLKNSSRQALLEEVGMKACLTQVPHWKAPQHHEQVAQVILVEPEPLALDSISPPLVVSDHQTLKVLALPALRSPLYQI